MLYIYTPGYPVSQHRAGRVQSSLRGSWENLTLLKGIRILLLDSGSEPRMFRGWYVQASMELGPEDVSLLKRCPHLRGWYV